MSQDSGNMRPQDTELAREHARAKRNQNPEPCCGDFANCMRPCFPRGVEQGKKECIRYLRAACVHIPADFAAVVDKEFWSLLQGHPVHAPAVPSATAQTILPPAGANGKRPRLFYWEETEDCWCPAEGLEVANIIDVDIFLHDGEELEVRFKRQDMTDAEHDAIPEG
jgi:hypothetical protein